MQHLKVRRRICNSKFPKSGAQTFPLNLGLIVFFFVIS